MQIRWRGQRQGFCRDEQARSLNNVPWNVPNNLFACESRPAHRWGCTTVILAQNECADAREVFDSNACFGRFSNVECDLSVLRPEEVARREWE